MRLLRAEESGEFSLVEYIGKDIPQYAILSHTWGADSEEVTFKDLRKGRGKDNIGYRKLSFCGERAAQDGLRFFWIDTCCIDKTSSAELSEAINSMFQWYQKADRCYVYLSDISIAASVGGKPLSWEILQPLFQRSRWFTRGWTLQELLAPTLVEFFSADGVRLGEKKALSREIHDITGISTRALQGDPLSSITIVDRLSWAERRQTKREEDAAYSLLGIFGVHIPIIYGEGRKKAFQRLQVEIDRPWCKLEQHVDRHTRKLHILDMTVEKILHQIRTRPKELGFPWETGLPEDKFMIDDGLGLEYYLPVELCKTPEVMFSLSWRPPVRYTICDVSEFDVNLFKAFFRLLNFRYKSRRLPGLQQVERGHIQLYEWNERHLVSQENWLRVVKGERAVKVSFVMGNWQGPPRNRCMRCFKPRTFNKPESSFNHCSSCKLAVRWVAPDFLPYKPVDVIISDPDTYRDYQVASRRQKAPESHTISDTPDTYFYERRGDDLLPNIDLVCHRLTMKWEPIINCVYRYMFCRCVMRLNTPSRLIKELTVLMSDVCPRHNTKSIRFRDYSELSLPCLKDPYFDQFGGYNAFWALLHKYLPDIYHHLKGSESIADAQLEYGYTDLRRMEERDEDAVRRIVRNYQLEVLRDMMAWGMDVPPDVLQDWIKEEFQRVYEGKTSSQLTRYFEQETELEEMFQESHMGKELRKIGDGEWDGIPHWSIEE